jgi:hypothetical protein
MRRSNPLPNFNPSTATRFFLAFLFLFIILFSLSNLLFLKFFMPQFEEELEAYNLQILTNTKTAADEYIFSRAEEEYMSVLLSGNEKDYFYPLVQNPADNLWRPLNAINQLKETVSYTEDFFHSISLYFPEKNFILSSAGFKFLNNENNTNILEFPWLDELKNLSYGGRAWFLSKAVVDYNEIPYEYTPVLAFSGTYPPHSKTTDCLAHIVLEIPLSQVDRLINQYEGLLEGNFWITYNNRIIYSRGDESATEKESVSYIESSVSSRFEGIEYHYALLESVLFSKTIRIRNNLYLLMGVSLILSLIFSWYAAKIMVRPIDKIADTARTLMGKLNLNEPSSYGNELDDIGATLTLLAGRLEQSMPVMKSSFFTHLVRGELDEEQIEKQKILYAFSHDYNYYQTAIIQIKGERSRINLLAVQLLIMLQEKSEDFFYPFPFGADKIVIAAGWDTPDLFMEFCLESYDSFKKKSGFDEGDVIIAIGESVKNLTQLNNSFDSALKRLPRYFLFGGPLLEASDSSEAIPLILPSSSRWGEVSLQETEEALVELFDDVKETFRQTNMEMDEIQLELNRLSESIKSLLGRGRIYDSRRRFSESTYFPIYLSCRYVRPLDKRHYDIL